MTNRDTVGNAVPRQVVEGDVEHEFIKVRAQFFRLKTPHAVIAVDPVFAAENDIDHAVSVEVGQDQWVDENVSIVGRNVLVVGRLERRRSFAFEPLKAGEINLPRAGQLLRCDLGRLPLHLNVTAQDAALGQARVDDVERDPKHRLCPTFSPGSETPMSPLTLLEHPAVGLPLAKRLGKLLLRPNRPALGQAGAADAGLPLLSRLRLAKLQRLDRHGRQHVERIRPGEEVVPKLDDRLAMIARGQLIRPRGGIPLPMPSLDRGDLLHHLFLDQAAIRPIRGCWLSGNSRLIWLAGRVSRVSRDELHHDQADQQHNSYQRQNSTRTK